MNFLASKRSSSRRKKKKKKKKISRKIIELGIGKHLGQSCGAFFVWQAGSSFSNVPGDFSCGSLKKKVSTAKKTSAKPR